jgi:hypothetical protein
MINYRFTGDMYPSLLRVEPPIIEHVPITKHFPIYS